LLIKNLVQGVIDDIHNQFVDVVLSCRDISREKIENIADARIFTGRQALKAGLVDDLGNMEYAIDTATNLAGIEGRPEIIYPEKNEKACFVISQVKQFPPSLTNSEESKPVSAICINLHMRCSMMRENFARRDRNKVLCA